MERGADVLLLCMSSGMAGTEQSMRTLARGLLARGIRCDAWLPLPLQSEHSLDWFRECGAPTRAGAAFMGGWSALGRAIGFYREHRRRPVNVHLPWLTPSLSMIVAMRLAGVRKIVVSPHGGLSSGLRRSSAWAYNLATHVVVTTPYQAEILSRIGVRPKKLRVVPLGVPDPPDVRSPLVARADDDRLIVGTLCRLVPLKRVDALVRVCAAIPDFSKRFRLLIGGSGPEEESLRRLADEHPNVEAEFLGRVDEPWRFFQSIDVFALVSELESFGLVYIEAAQQGVPSIGCGNGGVPYAIRDGETGFLVDPATPEAGLRDSLLKLYHDRNALARMSDAAKEHAKEFSESAFIDSYAELLKA